MRNALIVVFVDVDRKAGMDVAVFDQEVVSSCMTHIYRVQQQQCSNMYEVFISQYGYSCIPG